MNEKEDDPSLCGCCAGADSPAGHAASSSGSGSSGCLSDACCHCIADHSANPGCHAGSISFTDTHTDAYPYAKSHTNADSNTGEFADLGVHTDTCADAYSYSHADTWPDSYADTYPHSDAHPYSDAYPYSHAHSDANTRPGNHALRIRTQNAGI